MPITTTDPVGRRQTQLRPRLMQAVQKGEVDLVHTYINEGDDIHITLLFQTDDEGVLNLGLVALAAALDEHGEYDRNDVENEYYLIVKALVKRGATLVVNDIDNNPVDPKKYLKQEQIDIVNKIIEAQKAEEKAAAEAAPVAAFGSRVRPKLSSEEKKEGKEGKKSEDKSSEHSRPSAPAAAHAQEAQGEAAEAPSRLVAERPTPPAPAAAGAQEENQGKPKEEAKGEGAARLPSTLAIAKKSLKERAEARRAAAEASEGANR